MEMFLIIMVSAVPVLLLMAVLMVGQNRKSEADEHSVVVIDRRTASATPQFFGGRLGGSTPSPRYPTDDLLDQLERHVLLEQGAAESYVELPTSASLHSRTASPFLN